MKQYLTLCFVLALALAGCAAPRDLQPPTPTLPAPPITLVETGSPTAVPSPPEESPALDEVDETEETAIDEVDCAAELTIATPYTPLHVGEAITISITYNNQQGCFPIGLPQFSLWVASAEGERTPDLTAFDPPRATAEPVNSIGLGQTGTAEFVVNPLRAGDFFLQASINYEYQPVGPPPQPWVWGSAGAQPLAVQVAAFDMTQLPECIPPADLESLGYDWRDCTLTEIEGSDGWVAVQWGRDGCNQPGQLTLVNLNTGELRRFQDRPATDFLGERADETAVWGDSLLMYRESLTAEKWLMFSGGCHLSHDSYQFLYDVTQDSFRRAPLGEGADWNETRTAGITGSWGYSEMDDSYSASISGYHLLTDKSFGVNGDRYLWAPDSEYVLLQTLMAQQSSGPPPEDSTYYDEDNQNTANWPLVTFSPPRSIKLANTATGEITLLAGEDGYSYWLCESEEPCEWEGDWLPIRRIAEQPAQTFVTLDMRHPAYRCYETATDCPVPVEYFLLNWRTGERTPFIITAPTPTPPPPSDP